MSEFTFLFFVLGPFLFFLINMFRSRNTIDSLKRELKLTQDAAAEQEKNAEREMERIRGGAEKEIEYIRNEAEKGMERIQSEAEKEIASAYSRADRRIREIWEAIDSNKETLMQKSEKELLVDVVSYIDRYAHRLDRMENKVSALNGRIDELSLDVIRTEANKSKSHAGVYEKWISQDVFENLVNKCTKGNRVSAYVDEYALIHATVTSESGKSAWKFTLDFNDNGNITGNYSYYSENSQSSLPENIGDAIKKEILFHLH